MAKTGPGHDGEDGETQRADRRPFDIVDGLIGRFLLLDQRHAGGEDGRESEEEAAEHRIERQRDDPGDDRHRRAEGEPHGEIAPSDLIQVCGFDGEERLFLGGHRRTTA